MPKLYHCKGARSVRPLWTLEEMGIPFELESMPFPPRALREGYLDVNPLGTVPTFVDDDLTMTESAGICQYLVDRYGPTDLALMPRDKDYGLYLNWLHRSDATLTFPQTIVLRYTRLEPEERRLEQAVEDYTKWFFARLRVRRAGYGRSRLSLRRPLYHRRHLYWLRSLSGRDAGPAGRLQAQYRGLLSAHDGAPSVPKGNSALTGRNDRLLFANVQLGGNRRIESGAAHRHTAPSRNEPRIVMDRTAYLAALERKVLWLASWTIHNANHLRDSADGMKVGGHQASSASLATIMTALYFGVLKPEDRVAVKPHASPIFHAIQYLFGRQTIEKLENFRGYGGAQSYPSRTKDIDDVDFSTGSVGLGVAMTSFASMVQDYVHAHGWAGGRPKGRMIALVGDAELDEGNIYEALLEGWKFGLKNTWWIIDYNRQSLDAVVREDLHTRFEKLFQAMGWDLVVLKYGKLQQAAFAEPGGDRLRQWIDSAPNQLYSALTFQGGAAWRRRLMDDLGDQGDVTKLIERRSDVALSALMNNLGGHDVANILEAFEAIDHDRPVCFLCYTVKGFGLPLAGHKDNHAGLMNEAQMAEFRAAMNMRDGREWDKFEGLGIDETSLQEFIDSVPFAQNVERRHLAPRIEVPESLALPQQKTISTQAAFGNLLNEIGRARSDLASHIVTTSPDVTVSTNLGAWVNRRGLFGINNLGDTFREHKFHRRNAGS